MKIKVALGGAQGSGKTTIAMMLAGRFSAEGYITAYIAEYAREFIGKYGAPPTTAFEELAIVKKQRSLELLAAPNAQLIFMDCPIFVAFPYTLRLVNFKNQKDLEVLTDIYKEIICALDYDFIYFLDKPDILVEDGIRTKELRDYNDFIHTSMLGFLNLHNMVFKTIGGSINEKAAAVYDDLAKEIDKLDAADI